MKLLSSGIKRSFGAGLSLVLPLAAGAQGGIGKVGATLFLDFESAREKLELLHGVNALRKYSVGGGIHDGPAIRRSGFAARNGLPGYTMRT